MKIIIAGGRDFIDLPFLRTTMAKYIGKCTEVVCGGARGADKLGAVWANENNIPTKMFPANWDAYGKSAGYRRNVEMAEHADALVAFWDGKSAGTGHMIRIATGELLEVEVVEYAPGPAVPIHERGKEAETFFGF